MKLAIHDLAVYSGAQKTEGSGEGFVYRVVADSKEAGPGTLFVPIIGERYDAHRFIPAAYKNGCRIVLSSKKDVKDLFEKEEGVPADLTCLYVEDTLAALQKLAAAYRKTLSMPFIAITGSVGKTSTREMTALAFSGEKLVYSTKGNFNSQIGVPLTLLEADPKSDLAVLEAGMSQFGEMERLAAMICPDGAIFTNIGDAHIGQLHTRENILQEKSFLVSGMKKDGFVILNGEDPLLTKEEVFSDFTRIYYGTDLSRMHPIAASHRRCYARDIRFLGGRTRFVAVLEEEEISVSLSVFGRHQVSNAMAALTAVKVLSGNVAAAAKKLEEFKGFAHRQQIFEKEGIQIIDDSYNASPDSMRAGIRLLRDLENGDRRIAVLGDMKELGPREIDRHKEIAVFIVEEGELDTLFTLGALAEHIGRELKSRAEARGKKYEVFPFFDKENLAAALKAYIKKGDAVLFKGSNSMGLFDIIEEVFYDNPFSHK